MDAGRVVADGHDFFSSPRLSPDGKFLAWLAWDHPNMPWNGTTLYALSPSTGVQRLAATLPNAPTHFATPAAGDGQVFVPDGKQIIAFGSGCGTASTTQYTLADSDGTTWVDMDSTNLLQTLRPSSSGWALLEANADLWTASAGYNQDIGIFVSDNAGVMIDIVKYCFAIHGVRDRMTKPHVVKRRFAGHHVE